MTSRETRIKVRTIEEMIWLDLGVHIDVPETGKQWERMECPYCGEKRAVISSVANWFHCWHCDKTVSAEGVSGIRARFNHIVKGMPKQLRKQNFKVAFNDESDPGYTIKPDEVFAQSWKYILGYSNGKEGYPNDSGKLGDWAATCDHDENLIDSYVRQALYSDMHDWASKEVRRAKKEPTPYVDEKGNPENIWRTNAKHASNDGESFDRKSVSHLPTESESKSAVNIAGMSDTHLDASGPKLSNPSVGIDYTNEEQEANLWEYRYLYMRFALKMANDEIAKAEHVSVSVVKRRIKVETKAYQAGEAAPVHGHQKVSKADRPAQMPGELWASKKLGEGDTDPYAIPHAARAKYGKEDGRTLMAINFNDAVTVHRDIPRDHCVHDMVPEWCGNCRLNR